VRAAAIALLGAVAWGGSTASGGEAPVATAGLAAGPAELARCEALRRAVARGESVRVLPPIETVKLRARPARLDDWPRWEDADADGQVRRHSTTWCRLPFWVQEPVENAPVVDRVTGLMWSGGSRLEEHEAFLRGELAGMLRRRNARKLDGFADWRLPTMPELLSLASEQAPYPTWIFGGWSSDRSADCQWGMVMFGEVGGFCSPAYGQDLASPVQPVRTITPGRKPPPVVVAGPVSSPAELAACRRAEWAKFGEGRAVKIRPRDRPATLRANPAPLTRDEIVDRLGALYLAHDDGRCFVNDYRALTDGSVLDAATGLAWEVGRSEAALEWTEAWPYVHRLNDARYLGHDDWRLPTLEEAATLIESVRFLFPETRLDPAVFATSATIWTADPRPDDPHDDAWALDTATGDIPESRGPTFVKVVRSVGQAE